MDIDHAIIEIGDGDTRLVPILLVRTTSTHSLGSTVTHSFILDDTDDNMSYDSHWDVQNNTKLVKQYHNSTFQ
jgi:hypothetical protein